MLKLKTIKFAARRRLVRKKNRNNSIVKLMRVFGIDQYFASMTFNLCSVDRRLLISHLKFLNASRTRNRVQCKARVG